MLVAMDDLSFRLLTPNFFVWVWTCDLNLPWLMYVFVTRREEMKGFGHRRCIWRSGWLVSIHGIMFYFCLRNTL